MRFKSEFKITVAKNGYEVVHKWENDVETAEDLYVFTGLAEMYEKLTELLDEDEE